VTGWRRDLVVALLASYAGLVMTIWALERLQLPIIARH
jgi:hypothetical protein